MNEVSRLILNLSKRIDLNVNNKLKGSTDLGFVYSGMQSARKIITGVMSELSSNIKKLESDKKIIIDFKDKAREIGATQYERELDAKLSATDSIINLSDRELKNLEKAYQSLG